MAVTLATFKVQFPEFVGDGSTAFDAFLQRYLDNAASRTPADVWGALADQGTSYLAAHLLAITPYGINAKLASKVGESVYGQERMRLSRIVASGGRVAGQNGREVIIVP